MTGQHDARRADDGHTHEPVQHRDGKPPWCPVCGLTSDGRIPESRLRAPVTRPTRAEVPPELAATFTHIPLVDRPIVNEDDGPEIGSPASFRQHAGEPWHHAGYRS